MENLRKRGALAVPPRGFGEVLYARAAQRSPELLAALLPPAWEGELSAFREFFGSEANVPMEPVLRRLSVLMPVYNERWTLAEIIRRVFQSPVGLEIELVVVDDGSTDGSWEVIAGLAAGDSRIKPIRHQRNRGKGAAVRTAIAHMTGDIAVIQDADLEYDPADLPRLLAPILSGAADAVFGSRYLGHTRRVLPFWHTLVNKAMTLASNAVTNLTLTDMETCYKMVRADVLRCLRLQSDTFAIEPELTCRLAQAGAEIYEVPIRYTARGYAEGKKIRPWDGLGAIAALLRTKWAWRQFSHHQRWNRLGYEAHFPQYHARLAEALQPHLGPRVLHLGAGIGTLSRFLVDRPELLLVEWDPICRRMLARRLGHRSNVRIACQLQDVLETKFGSPPDTPERFDAIVCSEPVSDLGHDWAAQCFRLLVPGGRWVLVATPSAGAERAALGARLLAAGFDGVMDGVCQSPGAGRRWLGRLAPGLARRRPACVLAARKPAAAAQRAAA